MPANSTFLSQFKAIVTLVILAARVGVFGNGLNKTAPRRTADNTTRRSTGDLLALAICAHAHGLPGATCPRDGTRGSRESPVTPLFAARPPTRVRIHQ